MPEIHLFHVKKQGGPYSELTSYLIEVLRSTHQLILKVILNLRLLLSETTDN